MIDNPHDAFFKLVFSQPEHAAGELRFLLPPALSGRIDWESLKHCPGSFVDEDLAQMHTDLLFSARLDGQEVLLHFLFEHLSTVQPLIPYRMLRYEVRIWDDWLSKHASAKKLPPIVPLVLHHSESGWHGATQFQDLLDVGPEALEHLAPFVPHFRIVLDDVSKTTDEALRHRAMTAWGTVALWCLRDARKTGALLRNLGAVADLLTEIWKAPNGASALASILRYTGATSGRLERVARKDVRSTLKRLLPPVDEAMMETLLDQMHEMFMEEGIERGRQDVLIELLRLRFGELPGGAVARVRGADVPTLTGWTACVLTARTLDEVWAAPPK